MSKEMTFFIYLIENYAFYKNTTADKVMKKLKKHNILDIVYNNYEFYHIERLENAYKDIDDLINNSNIDN